LSAQDLLLLSILKSCCSRLECPRQHCHEQGLWIQAKLWFSRE